MPQLRYGVAGHGHVNRLAVAGGAVLCSLALAAGAPQALAAERGTIRGRVVNAGSGKPQPGVRVTLRGGARGEVLGRVRTEADGRYVFSGLRTGRERPYALDATYSGGLFAGRAVVLPEDGSRPPVLEGTLRVWDTTTDPGVMLVRRDDLFLLPEEGALETIHSVRFSNTSSRAYIGRGGGDAGPGGSPTIAFSLPAGAVPSTVRILQATLDIPRLVSLESLGGFGATVAIPPGESQITFSYRVEGAAGRFDLTRRALYPVLEQSVHAEQPLEMDSDRLLPAGEVTLRGTTYRRWSARRPLDAGDPVQASVTVEAGVGPLVAGSAALLVLAAVAAALVVARSRRRRRDGLTRDARPREGLLTAIAELDLRYEGGEITPEEWSRRRAELKDELARAPA